MLETQEMELVVLQMLLDWVNDELANQRIIVKDLEEDMFDGQILQKLIGQCRCIFLTDISVWASDWNFGENKRKKRTKKQRKAGLVPTTIGSLPPCSENHGLQNWCAISEKLIGEKLEATEVSQSEIGQKQKLRVVLDKVNRILNLPPQWSHAKWSVDSKLQTNVGEHQTLIRILWREDIRVFETPYLLF